MSFTGFKTTRKGRALIAKVLAEKQLAISRVAAGAGICEKEGDIDDMENLIDFRVLGTSTEPKYDVETMTMTVEFRRDLHEGVLEGFWLSEFGIFAIDPDEGEILMYYYSFGDEPQHLNGTNSKTANVLRYPVSVTIGEDMEVISLGYPAGAFLMPKDLSDHDSDPEAHKELFDRTSGVKTLPLTIPTQGWEEMEEPYPYALEIPLEEVTAQHFPSITIHKSSLLTAISSNLCPTVESFDGGIRLWAELVPEADMTATLLLHSCGSGGGSGGNYVLPVASPTQLGGVKIGNGVKIAQDGTITATAIVSKEHVASTDEADKMLDKLFPD